jgi:hypothetical protein
LLVSGVLCLEALAFGGQLYGEGGGAGHAGVIAPDLGVGGLVQRVSFGLCSEPELPADIRRSGAPGALTLKNSRR